MLERLRPRALRRVDHEQEEVDPGRAGDHRPHEPLVAGHVDEREPAPVGQLERGVAEVDRDPAALLLGQPVGVLPGQRPDEPRLAVVDVPRGAGPSACRDLPTRARPSCGRTRTRLHPDGREPATRTRCGRAGEGMYRRSRARLSQGGGQRPFLEAVDMSCRGRSARRAPPPARHANPSKWLGATSRCRAPRRALRRLRPRPRRPRRRRARGRRAGAGRRGRSRRRAARRGGAARTATPRRRRRSSAAPSSGSAPPPTRATVSSTSPPTVPARRSARARTVVARLRRACAAPGSRGARAPGRGRARASPRAPRA